MTMGRGLSTVGVAAVLVAGAGAAAAQPADETALAERGAYVARAADCVSCHTGADGEPFAGGQGFPTPFGRLYAPNITPDRETGIGTWTRDDFEGALRRGVRKDGSELYPAMPYASYTKITDADVDALFAYFKTVEPVKNVAPDNELDFPFDIRSGIAVWQTMFFEEGRFEPDPERSEAWNRGAYLVQALAHCGSCHTPRNFAFARDDERALTGQRVEHWYAPDISGSERSVIRDWSTEELVRYLKEGTNDADVSTVGPMATVIHESLSHLEQADLEAMATYLKDQPPPETPPEPAPDATISAEELAAGERLYAMHCATCHERSGEGIEGGAPALTGNSAVTARKPYTLLTAILNGFPADRELGGMPAFATVLRDREVSALANYVRVSWDNAAEPDVTPWLVATWRNTADAREFGERGEPRLVCPAIGDAVIDPATREALAAAHEAGGARDEVQTVVDAFRAEHPDSVTADVVNRLSAAYCGLVAATDLTYREKTAELVQFMGRVAAVEVDGG